ncbi:MAG TPA: Ig-like domain-containing protein [Pyrinomonadaceae bacterium]
MVRIRPSAIFLLLALALSLFGLRSALSQSTPLRRVTNTTEEGININPSLSGDGRRIVFESTEDVARAGGAGGFRAIRADIGASTFSLSQLGATRAPAPGISQDGSRIAFASNNDPIGANADHNSEIFYVNGSTLQQITNTSPGDPTQRARNGNFLPSLSDDGRYIAFSSNRDLANLNADANFEIFIYDTLSGSFAQLTSSFGIVGSTDAKISGNAAQVAYIRDNGTSPGAASRDLILQPRTGGAQSIIADDIGNLSLTYGRAISDDGTRVVYSGESAPGINQVFVFDRRGNSTRQITRLPAPLSSAPDVPLHPTISGDGSRIAFATRRTVNSDLPNGDRSIELYTFDLPTGQVARVTDVPEREADGYNGSNLVTEVVSSLNDDGTLVAFNFPRLLSGAVADAVSANNSEIYISGTATRPQFGTLIILNGASFGNEPATEEAVAPDSIAVAQGGALAEDTIHAERQPDGTFPRNVGGTTVTVNGRAAQIFFVSPTQVNFLVPAETEIGDALVVVTNSEGFQSRGTIEVRRGAPGVFTFNGDGTGEGVILDATTLQRGPFDPTSGNLRLIIFATGVRNASTVTVRAGGQLLTVESITRSPDMPGMDEINVLVPSDLRGVGEVDLVVRADGRDSNPVKITFEGTARRDIVINEVLADPPDGIAGDANRDGVRDGTDDEFVELVNASGHDIDISGYQLFTRSTTGANDILRHTFAAGTIFPNGGAIVVFGGGAFNPNNPAFGGAQVFAASEGGLSLTNSGGVVTLKESTGALVQIFSYGGTTGLNGGNNQSLTRSPDITGGFTLHKTADGSEGRAYSPGTRVNGTPFVVQAIARIEVSPASATIGTGAHLQYTATAFDANNQPIPGVLFTWTSSNPAVATIDQNGLATGVSAGTTQIRASARGVQSAPATLTVVFVERVLTRIEVTPASATIPIGGTQQFTATAFDQFDNEMPGVVFTWESTNQNVATVDQNGLATGIGQGTTTIRASAQNVTGSATLNVVAATFVINEVLADPPGSAETDLQGDANHDGVRSASQDEFIEFVNASSVALNISGWTVRTHSATDPTERIRHTFAGGSTLPAGAAQVVFGGGSFDPANPVFGCAQVVKASSGSLSLTNGGLTIIVRDASGNLIAQFTYGGETGLNGGNNQSLTRSPDITGEFVQHTTAAGANGKAFSPGVKVDGTPFGNCPGILTSITISPASASVVVGQTTQFTAQAFDQFGRPVTNVTITFASSNTNVATIDGVTTNPTTGVATATVTGRNIGTTEITATATDGTTTVVSGPATLTVTTPPPVVTSIVVSPPSATINRGGTQQFTATAFNQGNPVSGVTFTWTSSNPAVATVDQNGLATGVGIGTVTITATANNGTGGTVSGQATLNVQVPLVINEILADPPGSATTDLIGDANRDGVRDGDDDEFVELVNNSNAPVDISGVVIADSTNNRFTFPAGTILAAGRAVVVFGGGTPPVDDPAFGGALVLTTSSLGLANSGDTVTVKLAVAGTDVIIATQTYAAEGGGNQSLTRSPDITGAFVQHTTATNAAGRVFSPGTRVDGTPFGSPPITRIEITPASATINAGQTQTFTARAFSNVGGPEIEVLNVSFIWDSSDPTVATVSPVTGRTTVAMGLAGGTTTIRAQAGGQQGTATLNVVALPIVRIEVTPTSATIPVGGTQQFTARAFDQNNNQIPGVTFTWTSSNTNVATLDQNGLATGVGVGTTFITASSGSVTSNQATLNVVAATFIINEVLADPPGSAETDLQGDANQDGVRSASDDEFIEFVNASNATLNLSGWTVRTLSTNGTTESIRHTFADNSTLAAGRAQVVFGGGSFDPANPNFGCAQVVEASSGGLSLTNGGLTIIVRDASGNLVAQFTYGGTTGLNGGNDQSLTRSPDITGAFVQHTAAANSGGRRFSPGLKVDGTPFGNCPGILTSITIAPTTKSIAVGQTTQFTAQAFDQFGRPLTNVTITFASSNTNVATVDSVTTNPTTGVATATVTGRNLGTAEITATATQGAITLVSDPATLTVTPPPPVVTSIVVSPSSATINRGNTQQFTATAFNQGNPVAGVTFTWTSSNPAVATVDQNGLATGVGIGTVTITATADNGTGGTVSGQATLNVQVPLVINEILADVPADNAATTTVVEGDANRDGVHDSDDDEFIELVNNSNAPVNISGVIIADSTSNRFTFPANTILAAGRAVVVFGGGTPPANEPAFGGALIFTTSSLGLNNTGDTVTVKLPVAGTDVVIATHTYGSEAGADQSITRSPDITGAFVRHLDATNAAGRVFSPGTRVDGTPFGSPPITRIAITPLTATIDTGQTQTFTARAFSNTGGPEVEVFNVSFIWESSDPTKASVSPVTGRTTVATGLAGGTTTIRARAGGQLGTATLTIRPVVASIELTPASATISANSTQTFTATAREANGTAIPNITFTFSLRNPSPANAATITATTANTVTVRGNVQGSVTVVASYTRPSDGTVFEDTSLLTITPPQPVVTSIVVSPSTATINRGNTQQFTATAFNQGNPVAGVTFTWTSSNPAVATVDQNGLATGVGIGTVTITATADNGSGGTISGQATLTVQVPLVINEILADPPGAVATDLIGDANRDGVRDGDDDEFVELVNNSNASVDISGVIIADATSNRFTFPANTILAAGRAVVIFGGGTPPANDPAFGGALIFTTSSLGLNNTGDTVTVKLPVSGTDVVIATYTYGAEAGVDQSITRSPDITGSPLVKHLDEVPNAQGRRFSPGTRVDGTPFGSPAITRIEVTPASTTIKVGQTQTYTARAFSNVGGPEVEVLNVSFIWDSSDPSVATVSPLTGRTTVATALKPGITTIRARAGGQQGTAQLTVTADVASIELTPDTATISVGGSQTFTAVARDVNGNAIPNITFTFSLRNPSPANAATITATTANTVTVRGDNAGSVTVVASYTRPSDAVVFEDTSLLTINPPPPVITSVVVSPSSATINRGNTQQFTATAFDQNNQPVAGAVFTWTSSNTAVATIDQNGLATGVGIGTVTITATTDNGTGGTVSGQATLNVQVPLVINEILADVPLDNAATADVIEGDANRDGVRNDDDDEFVELVNNSNAPVDISGVVITDATNAATSRFTFPANTILAAGRAVVVFGGGTPPANDPAFGGALIFTTTSLSLNNTADTVTVKLSVSGSDVVIATYTYAAEANADQSITRSPDITGNPLVQHTTAANADGRVYSPGTRVDGTPFGSPAITRIEVTPATAAIDVGQTQTFTARAFSNVGGPEIEVLNVSFIWDSSDPTVATVAPTTGRTTVAKALKAGSTTIRARAGGQQGTATLTVNAPPPVLTTIEVTPTSANITVGGTQQFTATAFDQNHNVMPGVTFTWASSNTNVATINQSGLATGVGVGTTFITASSGAVTSNQATLNVGSVVPPQPTAGQVIINEALVAFATSATQVRNDFIELFNTTAQALDISGLVISFRGPGNVSTVSTVTLPGAVGSGTTIIPANGYFLIVNGPETFGVTADFNATLSPNTGLDLNNTTGGIKIELNAVKLDGLAYQGGATPPAAPFNTYGEGTILVFASGTTNDLIRSPNATDTGNNATDFRRNGTAASVTPKAANPPPPPTPLIEDF